MPNWCDNTLHITHENPEMMKKVIDAWNSGEFFQTMRPCPQELIDTSAGYGGETEEQQENERRELVNLEKYGYKNWYDWRLNNWGAKWDIDTNGIKHKHNTSFSQGFYSAWSPPIDFYEYLDKLGYDVKASYFAGGMGFCGRWSSKHGDEFYQIEECTPKWIEENIPEDICEEYGLLECYAESDDEEEDDENE